VFRRNNNSLLNKKGGADQVRPTSSQLTNKSALLIKSRDNLNRSEIVKYSQVDSSTNANNNRLREFKLYQNNQMGYEENL